MLHFAYHRRSECNVPDGTPPELQALDAKGVAAMLSVSTTTVKRLRESGELPAVKIGNTVRWRLSTIRAFLAKRSD